ncbi:hypothetical protein BDF21DRAFT_468753 [Thamnidium elegans]|nr:hypothetical protein BDF21DRAFT_468753 [Thamnidium elegans]
MKESYYITIISEQKGETRPVGEVNIVLEGEVIDDDPLILEEVTRYIPADEVTEKEDMIKERITDNTRRRIGQVKGLKKRFRELDPELIARTLHQDFGYKKNYQMLAIVSLLVEWPTKPAKYRRTVDKKPFIDKVGCIQLESSSEDINSDIQEYTDDAEELPFITLPKPFTVNLGDIDFGVAIDG